MRYFQNDGGETDDGVNWPQTFVALGVVSVAAWGLWFFLRDKNDARPSPDAAVQPLAPLTEPDPGILVRAIDPVTGLPLGAPPVTPPSRSRTPLFLLGSPLPLKHGQHYRARLHLTGFQAAMASKQLVQSQFLANGFSDVIAYQNPGELPADWPAETRHGGSGVWWVEGNWTGTTGPVARQEPVTDVWEA